MIYKFNGVIFEWDDKKAVKVFNDHKITFEEACTVLFDEFLITQIDDRVNYGEERSISTGISSKGNLYTVVWTERDNNFRIITAFIPNKEIANLYRKRRYGRI